VTHAQETQNLPQKRKGNFSGKGSLQYGLIAEEVAQAFPDLVEYGQVGETYTVRYYLITTIETRSSDGVCSERWFSPRAGAD
jgi:hypothetical protein